ncbi:MAG: YdcF family protein [Acidobacteriota bacterium]|nr:YdcF family protein [Acidobacteriota bacterium]
MPVIWFVFAWLAAENLIIEKPLEKSDAIFVLSGSSTFMERCDKAAELFRAGKSPKIFLTNDGQKGGWSRKDERNPFYWELAERQLTKQGIAPEAIEVLPETVEGTRDEAILLIKVAKERNLNSILLVTSGYHSRRTLWIFERAAVQQNANLEFGIESPPVGRQTPYAQIWWLTPRGWRDVAGEYLKFAYYWLFY